MRQKARFSNTAVRSVLLALSALTLAVAPTGAAPEARDPAGAEKIDGPEILTLPAAG